MLPTCLLIIKYNNMEDVSSPARSAKLQIVYGLKMSKTAALNIFTIQTLLRVQVLRVWSAPPSPRPPK